MLTFREFSKIIVKFVELKCSFGTNNNRHIDECMTFMPYGASKYKIWMYIIEDIALDADLVDKMSKKYLYNDEEFDYLPTEQPEMLSGSSIAESLVDPNSGTNKQTGVHNARPSFGETPDLAKNQKHTPSFTESLKGLISAIGEQVDVTKDIKG